MQEKFWSDLSGHSRCRNNLVSVTYPRLRVEQRTRAFFFFEPTLLVVLAGKIEICFAGERYSLADPCAAGIIDQGVIADYIKHPADSLSPFRSLFVSLKPEVLESFYQAFQDKISAARKKPQLSTLPVNSSLHDSLRELLIGLDNPHLSDERIRLKIFDLLLVLSEQNIQFSLPPRQGVFPRLSDLLRASPETGWTARSAGEALAMSESTLRRRLREEGIRFEQLLLDIRMHHGLMLVQTTNWNMTQVADACGYKSVSRFAERFKHRFGLSPARLR